MRGRRRPVSKWLTPVAVGVLLLTTACGADGSTDARQAGVVATLGPVAHEVTAPVVGGGTLSLTDFRDEPLALWFWAPT